MIQARNLGGISGTVVLSWGFVNGKPLISVHSAALVEVLEWADFDQRIPARVLKLYDYRKRVMVDGRMKKETFWTARYWDATNEIVWRQIPDEVAKSPEWQASPHEVITHNLGVCPIVWVQNLSDDQDADGQSDADGQHQDFDQLDYLASATTNGTVANVDPTLVINDKKGKDETVIHKGSRAVIYSQGGASYLELTGSAVDAANKLLEAMKANELEEAEVVLLDPNSLSGAGVSAAALRTRFAPMLAKCDLLRDQYGEAIVTVLRAMLESARTLRAPKVAPDGSQSSAVVVLEPRIEIDDEEDDEGNRVSTARMVEREPGESSRVALKWPPYFPATWEDRVQAVNATTTATKKQVLSQQTAIESLASLWDIEDAKAELERVKEEAEEAQAQALEAMRAGAPLLEARGEDEEKARGDAKPGEKPPAVKE
jgi:hypothetical protein